MQIISDPAGSGSTTLLAKVANSQHKIKMLVNGAYWDKILSINIIKWIIKSIKGKKRTKMSKGPLTSWLLSPLPSRKTGSKTVNAADIKKAPAKSLAKRPKLSFQEWFLSLVDSPGPNCHLYPRVPSGERHQDVPNPSFQCSGGQSYSYSVTKLHNYLLFLVTRNVFVTF